MNQIRCRVCSGSKTFRKPGLMRVKCEECNGQGWLNIKDDDLIIENQNGKEQAESTLVTKKRKPRKTIEVEQFANV